MSDESKVKTTFIRPVNRTMTCPMKTEEDMYVINWIV